jgi:uncharacterized repeat protein (TIGR01451 family)
LFFILSFQTWAATDPDLSVEVNNAPLIDQNVTLTLTLNNDDQVPATATDTGYYPYFRFILPPEWTLSGVDCGAYGLGQAPTVEGPAPSDSTYTDPVTGELLSVLTGETVVTAIPGIGQLTPSQPAIACDFELTPTDAPEQTLFEADVIRDIRGVFALGASPSNNYGTCSEAPTVCSVAQTTNLTPSLININKSSDQPGLTSTGPSDPFTYTISGGLATGQTLTNVVIRDTFPQEFVLTSPDDGDCSSFVITPLLMGLDSCTFDNDVMSPTYGELEIVYTTLSMDFEISVEGYIPEVNPVTLTNILDPNTGTSVVIGNTVTVDADEFGMVSGTDDEDVTAKSVALRKSSSVENDVDGNGLTPGDTITWTTEIDISDYFTLGNMIITDVIGDGHTIVAPAGAYQGVTISVIEDDVTTVYDQNTVQADTPGYLVISGPDGNGETTITIDLSGILSDQDLNPGGDSLITGAENQNTAITLSYRTLVENEFVGAVAGDTSEVDAGDVLVNNVDFDYDIVGGNPGQNRSDDAEAKIQTITNLEKFVVNINGSTVVPDPIEIEAGDVVTYEVVIDIPGGDVENLVITDYLPTPLFEAPAGNLTYAGNGVTNAAPPANNQWGIKSADTTANINMPDGTTALGMAAENSIAWTFGDFNDVDGSVKTISFLFTLTATSEPIQNGLNRNNIVSATYSDTETNVEVPLTSTVAFTGLAPILTVEKVASAFNNERADAVIDGDGNVENVDAGDIITYEVTLTNIGDRVAYDIEFTDLLPEDAATEYPLQPVSNSADCDEDPGTAGTPTCDYNITLSGAGCSTLTPDVTASDETGIRISGLNIANGDPAPECVIEFDVRVSQDAKYDQIITTTTNVLYDNEPGGVAAQFPRVRDTSTVKVYTPLVTKALTSGPNPGVVGDELTFEIEFEVPEGKASDFEVRDLERNSSGGSGVDWWGNPTTVVVQGGISGAGPYCSTTYPNICFENDPTDNANWNTSSANTFYVDTGEITNTYTDNVAREIVFVLTGSINTNASANNYRNRAEIRWDNPTSGSGTVSSISNNNSTDSVFYTVTSPDLSFTKCFDTAATDNPIQMIDGNDDATYRLMVRNAGTKTAYQIQNVFDNLARGLQYTPNTINAYHCSTGAGAQNPTTCRTWTTANCAGVNTDITAAIRAGEDADAAYPSSSSDVQNLQWPVQDEAGLDQLDAGEYVVYEFAVDHNCTIVPDTSTPDNPLGGAAAHPDDDGVNDACTDPVSTYSANFSNSFVVGGYNSQTAADGDGESIGLSGSNSVNLPRDDDGDGFTNSQEGSGDADGDGVPNYRDTDSDNNGIDDTTEGGGNEDGDGEPDYRDVDDDNDGITDANEIIENQDNGGNANTDSDGDGIADYLDPDSDNDGLADGSEFDGDTDGDGDKDKLDLDSDNDGIPDYIEYGFGSLDTDNDGIIEAGDGEVPGALDTNDNGAIEEDEYTTAYSHAEDQVPDFDGDGLSDARDLDSDNDGLPDIDEAGTTVSDKDTNNDNEITEAERMVDGEILFGDLANGDNDVLGTYGSTGNGYRPDYNDRDSDNDGIADLVENGRETCDANDDGEIDYPAEGNGCVLNDDADDYVYASEEAPTNTDSVVMDLSFVDVTPDYLDRDSDGDGIADWLEAHTNNNIDPAQDDYDGDDGSVDGYIENEAFLVTNSDNLANTDSAGNVDYLDTDADGDGLLDAQEAGSDIVDYATLPLVYNTSAPVLLYANLSNVDSANDNAPDFRDLDTDNDGILDEDEHGSLQAPSDSDRDGVPNFMDTDSDNDGIADALENGDTDSDGILDAYESNVIDTDNDGNADFNDTDADGDGDLDSAECADAPDCGDADGDDIPDWLDAQDAGPGTGDSDGDTLNDDAECPGGYICPDTDGDGVPDYTDSDSDNDGVTDQLELGDTDSDGIIDAYESNTVDTDGDGNADFNDTDADGDGNLDSAECTAVQAPNCPDTDGDGIADWLDADDDGPGAGDSDGDGINDDVECPNGVICPDADGDGVPNYSDTDSDGDGLPDAVETGDTDSDGILDAYESNTVDVDGDGNADYNDTDADGDGDLDSAECTAMQTPDCPDTDGDGIADWLDPAGAGPGVGDSDGDGLTDQAECPGGTVCADTDGDNIPNYTDPDSDNDGVLDASETGDTDSDGIIDAYESNTVDTDGDGNADFNDTDADGDGNLDSAECTAVQAPNCPDTDGDGIVDWLDADDDGPGAGDSDGDGINDDVECPNGVTCPDTDGDGIPNYTDTDSDGDGTPDSAETADEDGDGILDAYESNTLDTDGDGNPDYDDTDSDGDGTPDSVECADAPACGDTDGDGIPDIQDVDDGGPGAGDSDNDGLEDDVECPNGFVCPDTDGDGVPNYTDTDSDNDGVLDGVEGTDDADADGTENYLDTDSDSDGIPDLVEFGLGTLDVNDNGQIDAGELGALDVNTDGAIEDAEYTTVYSQAAGQLPNADGDADANAYDLDSDNDGLPDLDEAGSIISDLDVNGDDRVSDAERMAYDPDMNIGTDDPITLSELVNSDNDNGMAVGTMGPAGDGYRPDFVDPDSDNDGVADVVENGRDTCDADNDGNIDYAGGELGGCIGLNIDMTNDDADGLIFASELAPTNTDASAVAPSTSDSIPDYIDRDSDGDGIADWLEAHTNDNIDPTMDNYDFDNNGYIENEAFLITDPMDLVNSEIVGGPLPDIYDLDSDGDTITDSQESGAPVADYASVPGTLSIDTASNIVDLYAELYSSDAINDNQPDFRDINSDNDGITDAVEKGAGTDPVDVDTDGVPDFQESDGDGGDPDNDGLTNSEEITLGTEFFDPTTTDDPGCIGVSNCVCSDGCKALGTTPNCPFDDPANSAWFDEGAPYSAADPFLDPSLVSNDADGDGCSDCFEGAVSFSNPNVADTDGDTINDCVEYNTGSSPVLADTDGDGCSDTCEIFGSGPDCDVTGAAWFTQAGTPENPLTDPTTDADADGDGLSDCAELSVHLTDPNNEDTDGGGIDDGFEINSFNSDPLDPLDDCPNTNDSDNDGLTDCEEIDLGLDPFTPSGNIQGSGTTGLWLLGCASGQNGLLWMLMGIIMLMSLGRAFRKTLLLMMIVAMGGQAYALNTQLFRPILGQEREGVTNYASRGLTHGQVEFGIYASFLENALEFGVDDDQVDQIVKSFLTTEAMLAWGVSERFTLHVSLPFNPYSNVEPIANFQDTQDFSLGDARISATIFLGSTQPEDLYKSWTVGLVPFVTIPFNNEDDFFGDTNFTGGAYLVMDRYIHKNHYLALNVGSRFRERERLINLVVDDEFLYGLTYTYRISCASRWDLIADFTGSTTYREFFSQEISSPLEAFFSVRHRSPGDRWEWTGGFGRGTNNGYGSPDYHVYTGLTYRFANKRPTRPHPCQAVTQPEPAPAPAPKPIVEEGMLDFQIMNADQKPVSLPFVLTTEMGKQLTSIVSNRLRRTLPVGRYVIVVKENGEDKNIPLTISASQTTEKVFILTPKVEDAPEPKVEYIDPIYFEVNQATIDPQSYATINHVAEVIKRYDNVKSVSVQAHTDSDGPMDYNLQLSIRRANAVKDYLVGQGINESKIRIAGFGEAKPRVANTSAANKAKNRRVEFELSLSDQTINIINR